MIALFIIGLCATYIAIGAKLAEPIGRSVYRNADVPSFAKKPDPVSTVLVVIAVTLLWPIAYPIAVIVIRIRSGVDAEKRERIP